MDYHNLNLSSKPFYNFKILLALSIFIYFLSIAFASYSIYKLYNSFKLSEDAKIRIGDLNKELKKSMEENNNLRNRLNSIDKKMVIDKAEEVNNLLLERTFSWSNLLETLENTLPEEVRLLSLSTSKEGKSSLNIKLIGLSSKRDGMLQTIEALKNNNSFKNIRPVQFQDEERSSSLGKRFEIQFTYTANSETPDKGIEENEKL